ncbi:MAG: PilZ domain-containing protein [Candidatus Accumulibacter sp.]|jgi:hypothetical protein|nr:PilZ domain-containing protein [Accumulibacter sp.]
MLKGLFGKNLDDPGNNPPSAHGRGKPDLARIGTLIEFFPIGKKLRYYPEFHQDIILDTLVVAYRVNDSFIYSMDSIETDRDRLPAFFRANDGRVRLPAAALKTFHLLVPDTSHQEMKLDYLRRAQIGRNGQFSVGNYISLISNAGMKGVSTIDTEVVRQIVLRDGPYAHMNLILLTPDFASLSVADQRKKPRAKTSVPVTLVLPAEDYTGNGTIVDVSDAQLRILLDERGVAPAFQAGDAMILDILLGETERRHSVKGSVVRCSAETCVIELDGRIHEGRLIPFTPLDLLELKAGLLNYSR